MTITPMIIATVDFISVVPPYRFISLENAGLMNEAKPIIRTIMPTIKVGVLAIGIPPYLPIN